MLWAQGGRRQRWWLEGWHLLHEGTSATSPGVGRGKAGLEVASLLCSQPASSPPLAE